VLGQNRGTQRHRPRKVDGDRELLGMMRKIVETFPRHGSERTHRVLTGPDAFGGWKVNFKRVHRIWKEEHMQVPQKQRKRRRITGVECQWVRTASGTASEPRVEPRLPLGANGGRQAVADPRCDRRVHEGVLGDRGRPVIHVPERDHDVKELFALRGAPEHLRSDNGPEFVA
jgi:putative transposase